MKKYLLTLFIVIVIILAIIILYFHHSSSAEKKMRDTNFHEYKTDEGKTYYKYVREPDSSYRLVGDE